MSLPLAYVFWHAPRRGVSRAKYEGELTAFQRSLRAQASGWLIDSLSYRAEGVGGGRGSLPWSGLRSPAYEDWYLVRDFQSLGALNEAAVDATNKMSHDEVAGDALALAGGVYKLLLEKDLDMLGAAAVVETWVGRPAAVSSGAFLETLTEAKGGENVNVWQRQMVLGPAPEFCIQSSREVELPKRLKAKSARMRRVEEGRRLS